MKKPFILKAFLIAVLRRSTYKYPPRYNCMNNARVDRGKYKCKECQQIVGRKFIRIDHKIPVVDPELGFPLQTNGEPDWNTYIPRMFCDESNFQALCLECHAIKTKAEKQVKKKLTKRKKRCKIRI